MHFTVLTPCSIPEQKPDPEQDARIKKQLAECREYMKQEPSDFMASIFVRRLTCRATPFSREVDDTIAETLEPYASESENPADPVFEDCTEDVREKYQHGTMDCVRWPDGRVTSLYEQEFGRCFVVEDSVIYQKDFGQLHHSKRSKKAKKMKLLPDYPLKKLFRSELELAEKYFGFEYQPEEDAYGYIYNAAAFYDWMAIGGRWPHYFLVPESCREYSLGNYDGSEEDTKGPEGYIWVAAARKKDIAWDVMRNLRKSEILERYRKLKQYYETKTLPENAWMSFTPNGISQCSRTVYINGESEETFCARNSCPECKYAVHPFGYLAEDGYHESTDPYPSDLESAQSAAAASTAWAEEVDAFIDNLPEDTVLVCVDCHT